MPTSKMQPLTMHIGESVSELCVVILQHNAAEQTAALADFS
jgi:hypothetical protein